MKILYGQYLLVVDKPASLPVLPMAGKRMPYLVKMLEKQYGKIFIVHRWIRSQAGDGFCPRAGNRALNTI
jgi:hypothetical protein